MKAAGLQAHSFIKLKGAKCPEDHFNVVVDPSVEEL